MGDGLAAVIETLVTSKTTTTNTVSFKGTGEWFDEADLTTKYVKKPQQLAAILRNTRKVYDTIREITLYEDMKYVSCVANEEEESKATESSIRRLQRRSRRHRRLRVRWHPMVLLVLLRSRRPKRLRSTSSLRSSPACSMNWRLACKSSRRASCRFTSSLRL